MAIMKIKNSSGEWEDLVVDSLENESPSKALSANQGKVLNDSKANKSETYSKTESNSLYNGKIDKPNSSIPAGKFLQTDENGNAVWGAGASGEEVEGVVKQWLEDNISGGQTVAIDTSLSVQGAAAESSTVGEALDEIIQVDDTEPSSEYNKIWVEETPSEEIEIPDYEDFENLVKVSADEPTEPANKVWIKPSGLGEVAVTTYEEFTGVIAPDYDTINVAGSMPIKVGQHCIHNGEYYSCKTEITEPETFTLSHWTKMTVSSEASDLKSAMNDNGLAQLITDGWVNGKRWSTPAPDGQATGTEYSLAVARYVKVPCSVGDVFTINATGYSAYRPWAFFDSNNVCLLREENNLSVENKLITAPTNTAYLAINQNETRGNCYKGELIKSQIKTDTTLSKSGKPADAKATGDAINSGLSDYDWAVNLFSRVNSLTRNGYWTGDGYHESTANRITHPIRVLKGIEYKAKFNASSLGTNKTIAQVSSAGVYESFLTGTVDNDVISFVPTFNGFVSLNMGNYSDDEFIVSEADKFTANGQNHVSAQNADGNPLIGKKLSVNGDSICAGAGYAGGYAKMVGLRNNMTVQNIAENGATIVTGTQFAGGTDRHWISTSIVDMDSDSDYVIIEGGVNDDASVIGENKLGSLTAAGHFGTESGGEFINDFDPTTFCGALEYTFFEVYKRFPGKKVGFIIVHKCATLLNSNGVSGSNRYPLIVNACKKWGIPYCDLNTECPPLNYIPALKSAYTNDGDGWHPNEAGYAKYYVPKIEEWMKTL